MRFACAICFARVLTVSVAVLHYRHNLNYGYACHFTCRRGELREQSGSDGMGRREL
jgi:hypothetical protein